MASPPVLSKAAPHPRADERARADDSRAVRGSMANDTVGKHVVWTKNPANGNRIGFGYSTLKEAKSQAISLELAGYEILEILPTSLPVPNRQAAD